MKKLKQKFNLLGSAILLIALMACSSKNSYDKFIDDYEKIVVQVEGKAKGGKLTMVDLAHITSQLVEQRKKDFDGGSDTLIKITPAQQDRLLKLQARLSAATESMTNNQNQ